MGTFALDLSAFANKTRSNLNQVVGKVSLEMFRRVVMRSPVDTGRFRGNWNLGVGSAPTGYDMDASDKKGGATLEKIATALPDQPAGTVLYLANNLPYATELENGHSQKQAPLGMVNLTAMEFDQVTREKFAEMRTEKFK